MTPFLRRHFPIGPYTPKHWLDTDRRGDWLVGVAMGVCFFAVWLPVFLVVMRG